MLARQHRLRNRSDFQLLRKKGKRVMHPSAMLIYVTLNPSRNGSEPSSQSSCQPPIFGFSAGRRIGNAIVRNRAKRLMREAVRQRIDQISSDTICLFVARHSITSASLDDVQGAVDNLLKRAGLIRKAT